MKKFLTKSPAETKKLAAKTVKQLKGGEVLGLIGDLGSGKTVFVQGMAKALGVKKTVNSPTFVLMKIYETPVLRQGGRHTTYDIRNLVHVDAYRIDNYQELLDIGSGEYLNKKDSVVVIEWADKVKKILSKSSLIINFQLGKKNNERIITIK